MPDIDPDDDATTADVEDTDTGDTETADGDTGKTDGTDSKPAPKANAPKIDGAFDADRAARLIERLRGESKAERDARVAAEAKAQDTLKAVAKALGLADDDKPDPEKLTAQLEEARAAERQRRTENLVLRVAPKLGADPDVLLDSNAFLKAIGEYGPDARDDVEDTIRDFLKRSDRYKLLPTAVSAVGDGKSADDGAKKESKKPAGRSGADMNGSTAQPRQWTEAELNAALARPNGHREVEKARQAGLLDSLLGV